jgi:spore protease
MRNIRTDLAVEARELLGPDIEGIDAERIEGELPVERVRILNDHAAKSMGKPKGNYITIEAPRIQERDMVYEERLAEAFACELRTLLRAQGIADHAPLLIAGLGNRVMTPDSLGARTVDKTLVTRHIHEYMPEQVDQRLRPVCAITPGVLGVSGIETLEMVKGVVQRVRPAALIVIDALAARRTERISTTIQLCDTGINPGSGVGNRRKGIHHGSVGVPVLAVGIPMVTYVNSIALDVAQKMLDKLIPAQQEQERVIDETAEIIAVFGNHIVTPKEIDLIVEDASRVLANGLNLALHRSVTLEEVVRFMH